MEYLKENVWVWAGTVLVLLTLSGSTLKNALIVTGVTILAHAVISFVNSKKNGND